MKNSPARRARSLQRCNLQIFTLLLAFTIVPDPALAIPAFPGAEGFGSDTPGGRGGKLFFVTNTLDAGSGSLRAAIEAKGPRIVLFRTGGTIILQSSLHISNPYITIAGQTAPGGGIQIRNEATGSRGSDSFPSIRITTHDVVIRYLRIRPGMPTFDPDCERPPEFHRKGHCVEPSDIDGINIDYPTKNVVIDHVSMSWATDEMIGAGSVQNLTVQWSIISEGLNYMFYKPSKLRHGKGMLLGNAYYAKQNIYTGRASIHHNLWAHNSIRSPLAVNFCPDPNRPSDCVTDIANNVVYNWGTMGTHAANYLGHTFVNIVQNYYKRGPSTDPKIPGIGLRDWTDTSLAVAPGSRLSIYFHENVESVEGRTIPSPIECYRLGAVPDRPQGVLGTCDPSTYSIPEPHQVAPITTSDANSALNAVLAGAGANTRLDSLGRAVNTRDPVDRRIVDDVLNGTGNILTSAEQFPGWPVLERGIAPPDRDADGMPDQWERLHGFSPDIPAPSTADYDGDGYTDIEEFLSGTNPRLLETSSPNPPEHQPEG